MIDSHNNQEKKVEPRISWGLPVLPILFLIYISGVFEQVKKQVTGIVSWLFVNNSGFIASGISVKEITKTLDKVNKLVLE